MHLILSDRLNPDRSFLENWALEKKGETKFYSEALASNSSNSGNDLPVLFMISGMGFYLSLTERIDGLALPNQNT
jgi:hypothetical protein